MAALDNYLKFRGGRSTGAAASVEPNPKAMPTQTVAPSTARTDLVGQKLGAPQEPPVAAALSPTAAPAAKTDPTKTYIDRLTQTLSGNDPVVQNARQTAGTQNAVGDYLAQRTAKQESVNAGYTPGTLQSQRTADRYQAGANEAALARDAGVNELARTQTDTAMSQANQLRTEERSDIEKLISSVTDPVSQAYLRRIQAAGGDVRAAMAGNLGTQGQTPTQPSTPSQPIDPTTGLPRSLTPAETALKSAQDEASTFGLTPGSPEYDEYVKSRTLGAAEGQINPINEENRKAQKAARVEKALTNGLNALTEEEYAALAGDLEQTAASAIPVSRVAIEAAMSNPQTKGLIKLPDGTVYKIQDYYQQTRTRNTGSKSNRHNDFAVVTGQDGKTYYIGDDGTVHSTKPPVPRERGLGTKYDATRGVWVETYANSGGTTGRYYDPVTQKWVKG